MDKRVLAKHRAKWAAQSLAALALLIAVLACNLPGSNAVPRLVTEPAPVPVTPDIIPPGEPQPDEPTDDELIPDLPTVLDGVKIGNTIYVGAEDESQVDPVSPIEYPNLVYQQPYDVAPLTITPIETFPDAPPHLSVTNPAGTWYAIVIRIPADDLSGTEQLYIRNENTGEAFEITDMPLEARPIFQIAWAEGDRLIIDRWSQPHFGWRYMVDMANRETWAAALADDFFAAQGSQP